MALSTGFSSQELLQAQRQLWHQSLGYYNSVALVIALDLGIADAIHRLGGAATLPEILAAIDRNQPVQAACPAPPHARAHRLGRLQRGAAS
jgi:hypothetical protein